MNFIQRIIGMVVKPDDATKDIDKEPRIEEGLMVLGIYLILTVLGAYLAFTRIQYTGAITGMDASTLATVSLISGLAGAIIGVLVGWPIVTGAAHVLALFFGANGKFYPNMMTLIGYTCIPLIIVTILSMALTLLTPVTVIDLSAGVGAVTSSVLGSPLQILGVVITILGSLWTAYMMLYAVKNGEKLAMNNALIVVGILFVLNLLITYGSLLLALFAYK